MAQRIFDRGPRLSNSAKSLQRRGGGCRLPGARAAQRGVERLQKTFAAFEERAERAKREVYGFSG